MASNRQPGFPHFPIIQLVIMLTAMFGAFAGLLVGLMFSRPLDGAGAGLIAGVLAGFPLGYFASRRLEQEMSKPVKPPAGGWRRWDDDNWDT